MRTISNVVLALAIIAAAVIIRERTVHAQTSPSPAWTVSTVPLASCAWPAEVISPPPSGYAAYCYTTTGLAQAIAPSTTFTLVGAAAGVTSFNGRTGAVTLTDADVTGTGLKVTTTVTSTATSTAQ